MPSDLEGGPTPLQRLAIDLTGEQVNDECMFVAASPALVKIRSELADVAATDLPVLFVGPSGAGKETLARVVHKLSPRSCNSLVKVNCAAFPESVLERKLFGYKNLPPVLECDDEPGAFELAEHGTLFLAGVSEMAMPLQARIIGTLKERRFTRVGDSAGRTVQFRLVASMTLEEETTAFERLVRSRVGGALRFTLIKLPALRHRREDIHALLQFYLRRYSMLHMRECPPFSDHLLEELMNHSWPGNVRELKNFVLRYVMFGDRSPQSVGAELPAAVRPEAKTAESHAETRPGVDDISERLQLLEALQRVHWNRRRAANALEVSYSTLLSRIRKHGLDLMESEDQLG
jgi:DNA-binding NtrC family response regulator